MMTIFWTLTAALALSLFALFYYAQRLIEYYPTATREDCPNDLLEAHKIATRIAVVSGILLLIWLTAMVLWEH